MIVSIFQRLTWDTMKRKQLRLSSEATQPSGHSMVGPVVDARVVVVVEVVAVTVAAVVISTAAGFVSISFLTRFVALPFSS